VIFLTETLSWIDSNPGRERHGCFRLSTSTAELVDVLVVEVLIAWSVSGESSLELSDALSVPDGMMIDEIRSSFGNLE